MLPGTSRASDRFLPYLEDSGLYDTADFIRPVMREGSISTRYQQAATSGMTTQIKPGLANELELDIPGE